MTWQEALAEARRELGRSIENERRERERLRRDFDHLANQFRFPGSKFLIDLEYREVYTSTMSVAPGLAVGDVFERLPGVLHAVYTLSAYAPSSNTPLLITDGSLIGALPDTISVGIQRQRVSSPALAIEARIIMWNTGVATEDVAIRVWRRLGMGGA